MHTLRIPTLRLASRVRQLCAAGALFVTCTFPASARAAEHADCSHPISIAAASFTPRGVENGLAWDARYVATVDGSFDFQGGALRFAVPLPDGERPKDAPGIDPIVEGGRVTGLCVDPIAMGDRTIRISFVQDTRLSPGAVVPLGAPLASGDSVQIVRRRSATRASWRSTAATRCKNT